MAGESGDVIPVIGDGAYLDGADVSCAPDGTVRVAAARHDPGGSHVVLWRLEGDGAVLEWTSDHEPGLFQVRLVHAGSRPVTAAWCCGREDSRTVLLAPESDRIVLDGLAEPVPVVAPDGSVLVVGRTGEMIALVDADARVEPVFVNVPGGRVFSPAAAVERDGSLVVAWEQERPPGCCILTRRIEQGGRIGTVLRLDDGDATAHSPGLWPRPGGGVVAAWHAPARFGSPQLLVKDVRIALVAGDEVLVPAAGSAPDPGSEPRGEEQGFEFPVPVAAPERPVIVLGRGSHCYYSRTLGAEGWGERRRLDAFGWGCRGPAIRAALGLDGIRTVTRERDGLVVRRVEPAAGGPPAFERRRIVCAGGEGTVTRERMIHRDRDGCGTWFGDIHQHSAFSDGTGAPHETYLRARDFYCDEIVALSDHESFLGKRTPEGEWAYLQDLARRFEEPGDLATLYAYEWTGKMAPGPGHKVVYHDEAGAPLVSRDDEPQGRGLLDAIGGGGIALPHHVGWTGADEEAHDPGRQPCFEIVSCHGAYEREDDEVIGRRDPVRGPFILPLLESGMRFGLCGGSDGHGLLWQHGISRRRDAHRTGLTAVISRDLDRASVMHALRARSVYATSGERIWIRLWVAGVPMGGVTAEPGPLRAEVEMRAGAPVRRACLVMPGSEVELATGGAADWAGGVDVDPPRPGFVYLRVVRADNECAWSSPVFLD